MYLLIKPQTDILLEHDIKVKFKYDDTNKIKVETKLVYHRTNSWITIKLNDDKPMKRSWINLDTGSSDLINSYVIDIKRAQDYIFNAKYHTLLIKESDAIIQNHNYIIN